MPDKDYTLRMARYNLWQNENLLAAADGLPAAERQKDRGAFFGSIQKTLSHVLWGDMLWMSRFAGTPAPAAGGAQSTELARAWDEFMAERKGFDQRILAWAHDVPPDWFDGDLSWYSGMLGRELTGPRKMLVVHFFNHQTHHRGQVHAMLTAAGARPDDTDLLFMPERYLDL
ncbi:DinB family protein [Pararhodobacter sp. SW119]|uniref:DinB family protein n=1 Tax=Pararhodobacter sp. SW119 TaxID=2780075 RepID=UPI001AE0835F|nr:DinB family protein [Pararhodobacter sp. SW119]